ncbi:acetyltransferase [Flavobacterium seoulense]|uniref:N-acetylneuraminate synthase n=1 Tax=Flavobacterium seoulense TaxID=1492738 RepID=A0A066WMT1_9FLAO|nr:acetyltransferase [Flavobacterium seoulense]KDN55327.1 N-acetylneuraminate synthase [Flavobacterium seoulense]
MLDKEVILVGYSGHAYVVADAILDIGLNIVGYSDKVEANSNPYDLIYLGFEIETNFVGWSREIPFALGIGDNKLRQNISNLIEEKGKVVQTIIDKTAVISKNVSIGSGTFINKNVTVNSLAKIGKNVILNTGCIIEHECSLHDAVHIAPGAVLAGNVTVGERSFVGANSVVKQGVNIGKDVIIGAGSVIITNIPDGKKVVGNPGRII